MQGRDSLAKEDWKGAEKALIDALWVDQTASAVNAKSWIDLCKVGYLNDESDVPRYRWGRSSFGWLPWLCVPGVHLFARC